MSEKAVGLGVAITCIPRILEVSEATLYSNFVQMKRFKGPV